MLKKLATLIIILFISFSFILCSSDEEVIDDLPTTQTSVTPPVLASGTIYLYYCDPDNKIKCKSGTSLDNLIDTNLTFPSSSTWDRLGYEGNVVISISNSYYMFVGGISTASGNQFIGLFQSSNLVDWTNPSFTNPIYSNSSSSLTFLHPNCATIIFDSSNNSNTYLWITEVDNLTYKSHIKYLTFSNFSFSTISTSSIAWDSSSAPSDCHSSVSDPFVLTETSSTESIIVHFFLSGNTEIAHGVLNVSSTSELTITNSKNWNNVFNTSECKCGFVWSPSIIPISINNLSTTSDVYLMACKRDSYNTGNIILTWNNKIDFSDAKVVYEIIPSGKNNFPYLFIKP